MTDNDMTLHQPRALAAADPAPTVKNFLSVIIEAVKDPSVDVNKMHGLLDIQVRMMSMQAEQNFNIALTGLQAQLPRIKKNGKIQIKDKGTGRVIQETAFATYEDIDLVIRPLLQTHGFSLRFNSKNVADKIVVFGTLAHRDGHSITDEIPLTIDSSGSKNNVQGVGSTIAYGKRYIVGMLLNLVFEGEDDDGVASGHVSIGDDQAQELKDLLRETGSDVKAFLAFAEADSVDQISMKRFPAALALLKRKKAGQSL